MKHYYSVGTDELYHHGIMGMKWGVRRYQNADGSLTPAGRKHYGTSDAKKKYDEDKTNYKSAKKQYNKDFKKMYRQASNRPIYTNFTKKGKDAFAEKANKTYESLEKYNKAKEEYKTIKKERKTEIKSKTKELNDQASTFDKLIFNDKTRELTAKLMYDNDMTYEEASKKAKKQAIVNTMIFTGALVGLEYNVLTKMI